MSDIADWLRLSRTETVGAITARRLLARFGDPGTALEALPDLARRGGRKRPPRIPPLAAIEDEISTANRLGIRYVALDDPEYPTALKAIEDAPPVLTLRGAAALPSRAGVAMVGARNASLNGRRLAEHWARGLGEAGFLIVSGLARGIDTAAHAGSVETGTIAVVAGGADVIYPKENAGLYERILETGTIVSEYPPGAEPVARHFPQRNRIISGLSRAVVVIEAAQRSGSLISARLASEQGREVLAAPGSPLDSRAHGTNALIRHGATLVQSIEDILESLAPEFDLARIPQQPDLLAEEHDETVPETLHEALLAHLGPSPSSVDELIRACQVTAAMARSALMEMELAGRIQTHPGNRVSLIVEPID